MGLPTLLQQRRGLSRPKIFEKSSDAKVLESFGLVVETCLPDQHGGSRRSLQPQSCTVEVMSLGTPARNEVLARSCRVDSSWIVVDCDASLTKPGPFEAKVSLESEPMRISYAELMPPPGLELPAAPRAMEASLADRGTPVQLVLAAETWAAEPRQEAPPAPSTQPIHHRGILSTCPDFAIMDALQGLHIRQVSHAMESTHAMEAMHAIEAREAVEAMHAFEAMRTMQTMHAIQKMKALQHFAELQQERLLASRFQQWQHLQHPEQILHHALDWHLAREPPVFCSTSSISVCPVVVPPPRKFTEAADQLLPATAEHALAPAPARQSEHQKGKKATFVSKVIFPGYDAGLHADFDLVPRLIGRGGTNVRSIANACGGTVRIRGPGSGMEQPSSKAALGKEVPLHILLTCCDEASHELGKQELLKLLDGILVHFQRYIGKKSMRPVTRLYAFSDFI